MLKSPAAKTLVDAVPEFYHYEDTGCEISSSCLDCPLSRCKYDDPIWFQRHRRFARDLKVLTVIQSEDLTVEQAAERFSVTSRTIFRIIRRCREAEAELGTEELQLFAAD
jgi:hypothetical protein